MPQVIPSKDFLLDTSKGGWGYHEALGWTRNSGREVLFVHNDTSTFIIPDDDSDVHGVEQSLLFEDIQNLHLFGGEFSGTIALDANDGIEGMFSAFETERATEILNPDGFTQPFKFGSNRRRINAAFTHNNVLVSLTDREGTQGVTFNGTDQVNVEDEEGNPQTNTVPEIAFDEFFSFQFKVTKSLSQTMYLYVNDVLVGNPTFAVHAGGTGGERVHLTSGSGGGTNRVSYIKVFGASIFTGAPIEQTPWEMNNTDIVIAYPVLADWTQKADEGGKDYVQSDRLSGLKATEFLGSSICFLSGISKGEQATITDYESSTGKITFSPEVVDDLDSSTLFSVVIKDYVSFIDRAYIIINNEMRNKGLEIEKFIDFTQVKELHLNKTLELICLSKRQNADSEDIYHEAYLEFKSMYSSELTNLVASYDVNGDGIVDEDEALDQNAQVFLGR